MPKAHRGGPCSEAMGVTGGMWDYWPLGPASPPAAGQLSLVQLVTPPGRLLGAGPAALGT